MSNEGRCDKDGRQEDWTVDETARDEDSGDGEDREGLMMGGWGEMATTCVMMMVV